MCKGFKSKLWILTGHRAMSVKAKEWSTNVQPTRWQEMLFKMQPLLHMNYLSSKYQYISPNFNLKISFTNSMILLQLFCTNLHLTGDSKWNIIYHNTGPQSIIWNSLGQTCFQIQNFFAFRKVIQFIHHILCNIPSGVWGSTPQTHYYICRKTKIHKWDKYRL